MASFSSLSFRIDCDSTRGKIKIYGSRDCQVLCCWGSPNGWSICHGECIWSVCSFFTNSFCIFFIVLCCWQIAVRQTLFVRIHFSAYFTESSITFSLHSLKYKLGNMGKNLIKNHENTMVPLTRATCISLFFLPYTEPSDNLQQLFRSAFNKELPSLFKVICFLCKKDDQWLIEKFSH